MVFNKRCVWLVYALFAAVFAADVCQTLSDSYEIR